MNNTNRTIIAVIVVLIVAAAGWYFLSWSNMGSPAAGDSETVATVNGTPITRGQLNTQEAQLAAQAGATSTPIEQFQNDALTVLIGSTLLEQGAKQAGIVASSTAIESQLAAAKAQFSTAAEYEQALKAQGMTEADFKTQLAKNYLISTYLQQTLDLATATATEDEIQKAYDAQSAQQSGLPPLAQVHDQLAQFIVQQKQQSLVANYVAQLRAKADVQILIATSTPAA